MILKNIAKLLYYLDSQMLNLIEGILKHFQFGIKQLITFVVY